MGIKDLFKKTCKPILYPTPSPSADPDEHTWIREDLPAASRTSDPPPPPTPSVGPDEHLLNPSKVLFHREMFICPCCNHRITIDVCTTILVEV